MWEMIRDRIPPMTDWLNAFLSAAIPFGVYRINQWLHKNGDPPWKK